MIDFSSLSPNNNDYSRVKLHPDFDNYLYFGEGTIVKSYNISIALSLLITCLN